MHRLPAADEDGAIPSVVWGRLANAGTKLADHAGVPQKVLYLHKGAKVQRVTMPTAPKRGMTRHKQAQPTDHGSTPNALRVQASPLVETDQGFESTLVLRPHDSEDAKSVLDEWEERLLAEKDQPSVQPSRELARLASKQRAEPGLSHSACATACVCMHSSHYHVTCSACAAGEDDFEAFRKNALAQLPSYFKKLTGGYRYRAGAQTQCTHSPLSVCTLLTACRALCAAVIMSSGLRSSSAFARFASSASLSSLSRASSRRSSA